ncbi:MAG: PAS domain S-box protein [Verrucomicrobiaceae bacterium]|nr:MAG: PAS domain S-box protein [Verrucomicrobiaceae bacterium]
MLESQLLLFQSAFNYAAIGMALLGLDGRFLKVNRSLCEFLGYTEDELLSLSFQSITHPDDLQKDLELVQQLLQGECNTYQLEKRYYHSSGQVLWSLLSVSLGRSSQGKPECFISQIQDITARKEAEQDRDTLMSLPLVFQAVAGFDGFAKRVSPGFTEAFGYSEKELLAMPYIELFHPDDRAATAAEIMVMASGGDTRFFQTRFRCKDGTFRWLLWSGVGVPERSVFYAIGTDITPLKEAEAKAEEMLQEKDSLIQQLQVSASEIKRLQEHLITVCAWTKRIRYNGEWMMADKFLIQHLGLTLTHGISDEALADMLRDAESVISNQ